MHSNGEANTSTVEVEGKPTCSQVMRSDVYKCVESLGFDPKPGDLDVGRLKRNESYVEDR